MWRSWRPSTISALVDWIKKKCGILTWSEIVQYRQNIEWEESSHRFLLIGTDLEERVLGKIFGQVSKDEEARERLTFGFQVMFKTSEVFAELVKESIKEAVERSWNNVKEFERVAFEKIIVTASTKENEIEQSLAKIDNFDKFIHAVKLAEGYSVNDVWTEIFAYIRRVGRLHGLPGP